MLVIRFLIDISGFIFWHVDRAFSNFFPGHSLCYCL